MPTSCYCLWNLSRIQCEVSYAGLLLLHMEPLPNTMRGFIRRPHTIACRRALSRAARACYCLAGLAPDMLTHIFYTLAFIRLRSIEISYLCRCLAHLRLIDSLYHSIRRFWCFYCNTFGYIKVYSVRVT